MFRTYKQFGIFGTYNEYSFDFQARTNSYNLSVLGIIIIMSIAIKLVLVHHIVDKIIRVKTDSSLFFKVTFVSVVSLNYTFNLLTRSMLIDE